MLGKKKASWWQQVQSKVLPTANLVLAACIFSSLVQRALAASTEEVSSVNDTDSETVWGLIRFYHQTVLNTITAETQLFKEVDLEQLCTAAWQILLHSYPDAANQTTLLVDEYKDDMIIFRTCDQSFKPN